MTDSIPSRAELWNRLLPRLTVEIPTMTVWKPYGSALSALGDVDVAIPRAQWPAVEQIFHSFAEEIGAPVVRCTHIPSVLNLFAVVDGTLLQLEIREAHSFRGSLQWRAEDLVAAAMIDERGVRVLRPGAAGLLGLTLGGLRSGGRPRRDAVAPLAEQVRADPEGADIMARSLRMPTWALRRAAAGAAQGSWRRGAFLALEAAGLARAVLAPQIALRRTWFRRYRRPRCPVLQTVYRDGRRVTGPVDAWLEAARGPRHQVGQVSPGAAGRFIVMVGPDGVGKTATATALLSRHPGPRGYIDFRPPLRGMLPDAPPPGPKPRGTKRRPKGSILAGWLRLAKNVAWFWTGYLMTVRPLLRRGGFVVADRWAYGYVGQPQPLKFFGPAGVARIGVRLMPHPDLVVNLTAPPDVVVARKDELTESEVEAELAAWPGLPVPRLATVDAAQPLEAVTDEVLATLARTHRGRRGGA